MNVATRRVTRVSSFAQKTVLSPRHHLNASRSNIADELASLYNPPHQTKKKRRTFGCFRQAIPCDRYSRGNEGNGIVIESGVRRKKRGGLDVFQFAETVEPEAWSDLAKDLQVRPVVARIRSPS